MGLERICSAAHAVTEDRWHECSWLHVPARLDFDAELQTCCTTGAVSMVSERLASANYTIEASTYLPVRDRIFIMCESRSRRKPTPRSQHSSVFWVWETASRVRECRRVLL